MEIHSQYPSVYELLVQMSSNNWHHPVLHIETFFHLVPAGTIGVAYVVISGDISVHMHISVWFEVERGSHDGFFSETSGRGISVCHSRVMMNGETARWGVGVKALCAAIV